MAGNTYKGAHRGRYIPINPHKWSTPGNILYRSAIEYQYMRYFDMHPDILKIASEKVVVPYQDPVTMAHRRYIVDLLVQCKTKTGTQTYLIELKCGPETIAPKVPKVITEAYKQKVYTYMVNEAKWTAARSYCEKRGWIFKVYSNLDMKKSK